MVSSTSTRPRGGGPSGSGRARQPAGHGPGRATLGAATTSRRGWFARLGEQLERPLASYYLVLGATSMLLALGLVMVLSASSITSYVDYNHDAFYVFKRQLMWFGAGLPILYVASRLPLRAIRWLAYPGLVAALGLLALVPVMGVAVNGNRNWLAFGGPLRVQPSELAKLALILWAADLLARKFKLLDQPKHLLIPLLPVGGFATGLVLLGHDLGTALVLMAILAGILYFVGAPARILVVLAMLGASGVAVLSMSSSNRIGRLTSFTNPMAHAETFGYQAIHGKYALGSGGWFGLGLGASREKWGWLPEQQTDFIFAVIGEELGLVGTVAVLTLFGVLVYAGFRIALRTDDLFVRLSAAGITTWIAVQAIVNIGAVLGILPIIGLPLPLVSYGGSSLLPLMTALGLLLCFARHESGAAEALRARGPGLLASALHPVLGRIPLPHLPRTPRRRRTGTSRDRTASRPGATWSRAGGSVSGVDPIASRAGRARSGANGGARRRRRATP